MKASVMTWGAMLLAFATPHRWLLSTAVALALAEAAITLVLPWLAGQTAGGLFGGAPTNLRHLVVALIAVLAVQTALRIVNGFVTGTVAARLTADLKTGVFAHLQSLPLSFHQRRRQGDSLALLTHDVASVSGFISGPLVQAVPVLLTAVGAVGLMIHLDAMLALAAAALVPAFVLAVKLSGRRLRTVALKARAAEAGSVATANEALSLLPAIKSFTAEEVIAERYADQVGHVKRHALHLARINAALSPLVEFAAAAMVIVLAAVASERLGSGGLSAASAVSFFLYAVLLSRPVSRLASLYGQVQMCRAAADRLEAVLGVRPEGRGGRSFGGERVRGALSFEDVSFCYPGRAPALSGFRLDVAAGETVALTGSNGAGKTTLAHLLVRFYEPDQGRILIDGLDIAMLDLKELRQKVGLVPQHVQLLNGTIRDNIAFGQPNAGPSEIESAARLAQADTFIRSLPHGYETAIGDDGVRLSGGQRQRIALARALLKNPQILILDEATAMFDPDGERSFIDAFKQAKRGRTVLLITHRPASLALADRIVQVDHGRAVILKTAA